MKQYFQESRTVYAVAAVFAFVLVLINVGCVRREQTETYRTTAERNYSPVDINNASADELERLPGVGRAIAERIIEHRSKYGPFRRVEHIMMVRGISEKKFGAMEPMITVKQAP